MNGIDRRKGIIRILERGEEPISGIALSKQLHVSRQVIVQDIALIRANGRSVFSTNRGYVIEKQKEASRILKVIHSDDEVRSELMTVVDMGGKVKDVFVYHKVYGVLKAEMNITSRFTVEQFMEQIATGKSGLLKNVTAGYHYHTILADSEEILDLVESKLKELRFLAPIQEYEPAELRVSLEQKLC